MCKTLSLQKKQMQLLGEIIDKQKDQITALSNKASTLDKYYGSQLIWKIDNYSEKFNESKMGKKPTIFSPPFLTSRHGYKLALSTALYGDGKAKGKFMSLFLCICKGEFDSLLSWPFSHKITVTLLDQCEDISARRHVSYTIKPNTCKENSPFLGRPTGERNASFGAQKFVELDVLSSLDYVVDDTIFIKVEIDSDEMVLL
jgi:TNF receptor-associated factor 4